MSVCPVFPSALYPVMRNRGHFGKVSVLWVLEPALSGDVRPVRGSITFEEGEYLKNLTLFSVPDEVKCKLNLKEHIVHSSVSFLCLNFFLFFKIPEEMENFTITLLNATGGARLGNIVSSNLWINKNDDPIYFSGKDFNYIIIHVFSSLSSLSDILPFPSFSHFHRRTRRCAASRRRCGQLYSCEGRTGRLRGHSDVPSRVQ